MNKKQFDEIFNRISEEKTQKFDSKIKMEIRANNYSTNELIGLVLDESTEFTKELIYDVLTSVLPLDKND